MTTTTLRPLTPRQREVWRWIRDYHARERIGCSVRDVMAAFGTTNPNGAYCHLVPLRQKGWVEWRKDRANSIIPTLDSLEVCDAAT